jgi:hypothetical protein
VALAIAVREVAPTKGPMPAGSCSAPQVSKGEGRPIVRSISYGCCCFTGPAVDGLASTTPADETDSVEGTRVNFRMAVQRD